MSGIKLQIKRGNKDQLPQLADGEFGLVEDKQELYIGSTAGNLEIATKEGLGSDYYTKTELDAKKATYKAVTMTASGWNATTKKYSFEATYPAAQYDIEIQPADTCTEEQLKAWSSAQIVGSISANVATAYGKVPTVDIPIILKAVKK